MASSEHSESMMKQAQHIWSMLDDLSAQDPEAYRKFIDKQLKEGREAVRPPVPHMCVQTVLVTPAGNKTIFINIMDWPRIPAPKNDEDPIPTMGGTIFKVTDDDGSACTVVPVAFNTQVLIDYGIESCMTEERRLLINLAIDYVEDQNKVKLSRSFCILPKATRCKGPAGKSSSNLMKKLSGRDKEFESELGELEKTFGPLAAGCKDSLLKSLSSIESDDDNTSSRFVTSASSQEPEIRLPGEQKTKTMPGAKLIEEIMSTETHLAEPEHSMLIADETDDWPRQLVIKIQLPGVTSVRECSLEISDDDLYLIVPERYELALTLPMKTLLSEKQSAKFSRRTACLTVSIPVSNVV